MFRWYKNAQVCYVYLSDVTVETEFHSSRWFTRGWTLQELIAPSNITFYDKDWDDVGTKQELGNYISDITGIDLGVLRGQDLELVSAAKKMSWAALRQTTRTEDVAYCLLGIFDVNMPLLYGEGKKAFIRLQEEIMKVSSDQSLFAWGIAPTVLNLETLEIPLGAQEPHGSNQNKETGTRRSDRCNLLGLLAESPFDFYNSQRIIPIRYWPTNDRPPPVASNRGVRIELPLPFENKKHQFSAKNFSTAIIGCRIEDDYTHCLGLVMRKWDKQIWGRTKQLLLISLDHPKVENAGLIQESLKLIQVQAEKIVSSSMDRCFIVREIPPNEQGYQLTKVFCREPALYEMRTRLIKPDEKLGGLQAALIFKAENRTSFAVILGIDPKHSLFSDKVWVDCIGLASIPVTGGKRLEQQLREPSQNAGLRMESVIVDHMTELELCRHVTGAVSRDKWTRGSMRARSRGILLDATTRVEVLLQETRVGSDDNSFAYSVRTRVFSIKQKEASTTHVNRLM
jgi:hypothetical protein